MSHPSERLSLLINTLSLNVNSFSTECGYSSSTTIWRIINDNKKPSKPTLDKICARFKNVNKEWLLTGQGSMFFNKESFDDLTVTAKQVIDKLDNQAENITSKIKTQTEDTLNTLIVPKMLRHDLVTKADFLLNELGGFLNEFKIIKEEFTRMKNDIEVIHSKITNIEFIETVKAIEQQIKKENGGIDLN